MLDGVTTPSIERIIMTITLLILITILALEIARTLSLFKTERLWFFSSEILNQQNPNYYSGTWLSEKEGQELIQELVEHIRKSADKHVVSINDVRIISINRVQ